MGQTHLGNVPQARVVSEEAGIGCIDLEVLANYYNPDLRAGPYTGGGRGAMVPPPKSEVPVCT